MATDDNIESIFMDDLHFYGHPGPFVVCFTKSSVIGISLPLDVRA